jgi:Arc/MetJ-type ribon-helix-helix transcriptional regulator
MARYVVDVPERLVTRIRALLNEGKYGSVTDLVEVALENQLALENAPLNSMANMSTIAANEVEQGFLLDPSVTRLAASNLPVYKGCADLPPISRLLHPGETSEEDLYLWGQINRLFPIKLGLRVLWLLSDGGPVSLDELWTKAADAARSIGLAIRERQEMQGIKRAFASWVGLPVGEQPEKSLARYQSQFIGYPRRDGVLEGAMFRLKLAALVDKKEVRLTEAGLRWAQARNPLIDDGDLSALPLSEAESAIYANHVVSSVPEERRPLVEVLSAVRDGAALPHQIDGALAKAHDNWNENVVMTMRAGTSGRLWELGFLAKEGGHGSTSFSVMSPGLQFLDTVKSVPCPPTAARDH